MNKQLITTICRIIRIPDSAVSAGTFGVLIGFVLVFGIQPLLGNQDAKPTTPLAPKIQKVPEAGSFPVVLEHGEKVLTIRGEMAQLYLNNWQTLGQWEGTDITTYQNCPGLGYDGVYLMLKKGVMVMPLEYEPKCMSLEEFQVQRHKPEPYAL